MSYITQDMLVREIERKSAQLDRLQEEHDELLADYAALERYCEELEQGLQEVRG